MKMNVSFLPFIQRAYLLCIWRTELRDDVDTIATVSVHHFTLFRIRKIEKRKPKTYSLVGGLSRAQWDFPEKWMTLLVSHRKIVVWMSRTWSRSPWDCWTFVPSQWTHVKAKVFWPLLADLFSSPAVLLIHLFVQPLHSILLSSPLSRSEPAVFFLWLKHPAHKCEAQFMMNAKKNDSGTW